jgi:hypothetical protein
MSNPLNLIEFMLLNRDSRTSNENDVRVCSSKLKGSRLNIQQIQRLAQERTNTRPGDNPHRPRRHASCGRCAPGRQESRPLIEGSRLNIQQITGTGT